VTAFDIRCLVMEDVVELTGQKRTKTDEPPVCSNCGGQTIGQYVEFIGRNAYLHDFERLTRFCEDCGAEVDDDR